MKLVVLAAGEGVRMRPLTLHTPKPLLRFGGRTVLDHLFDSLPPEITEAVIVVRYLGEQIRAYCGNQFHGRKVSYIEGSLEGNAIGFMNTEHLFSTRERFAVSYGDELITKKEMEGCLSHEFSWLCYEVNNPKDVGVARIDSSQMILEVLEKPDAPPSNLVANGFMVVNSDIFDYKPEKHKKGEYFFSFLMNKFCKNHNVYAVVGQKDHSQLAVPEDVARLDKLFSPQSDIK